MVKLETVSLLNKPSIYQFNEVLILPRYCMKTSWLCTFRKHPLKFNCANKHRPS